MKLSKAIRRGVKISPNQSFFHMFGFNEELDQWEVGSSCALGAAVAGRINNVKQIKLILKKGRWSAEQQFPEIDFNQEIYNVASGRYETIFWVAANLNDLYKWTREDIADYLETYGL